LGAGRAQ